MLCLRLIISLGQLKSILALWLLPNIPCLLSRSCSCVSRHPSTLSFPISVIQLDIRLLYVRLMKSWGEACHSLMLIPWLRPAQFVGDVTVSGVGVGVGGGWRNGGRMLEQMELQILCSYDSPFSSSRNRKGPPICRTDVGFSKPAKTSLIQKPRK